MFVLADVDLYRESLAFALRERGTPVVGTAPCDMAAIPEIAAAAPDLLLVDVACGQALRLVAEVVAGPAPPSVIAIAAPENEEEIVACVEAGVSAFVPVDGSFADLLAVLARVALGESVVPPHIATTLIRRVRELADAHTAEGGAALTAREREIVALIDRGLSNKEIAHALSIEVSTVKNHVHNILGKLDVSRRMDAAAKVRPARAATQRTRPLVTQGSRSRP